MDKVGVALVAGIGMVAVMIVLAIFSAFTISTLWTWFIVPFGVQSVGMAHAYGIALFASLLQGTRGLNNNTGASMTLLQGVILNVVVLAFGGITVQFM